jgi:serine/threonine protein phosphatase PrpC
LRRLTACSLPWYCSSSQEIEITPEFDFLILACDGLWDTIKSKEAVKYVADRLNEGYSAKVRALVAWVPAL